MGKVNLLVKYCLRNEKYEYNIKGILSNKKLIFKTLDSKMILQKDENILKRINDDVEITFLFNEEKTLIKEKSSNKTICLNINILELENKDNYFKVKYKIDEDIFLIIIKIKWENGGFYERD